MCRPEMPAADETDPAQRKQVLHLVGSTASLYYYNLSFMYGKLCSEEPNLDLGAFEFKFVVIHPDGSWRFPESLEDADVKAAPALSRKAGVAALAQLDVDVVVPHMFCYEGMTMFRSLLDVLGLPYIGCSGDVMGLATDKAHTKAVMEASGVQVPKGELLKEGETTSIKCPAVVKPAREDNSLGLSLVNDEADLPAALAEAFKYDSKVLVEEYIAGREVRCAVLEEGDGSYTLLPMTEYFLENIRTSAHKLKTDEKGCVDLSGANGVGDAIVKTDGDRQCPATVSDQLTAKIKEHAVTAHKAMGARDFSLYDVRIRDEEPYFLEACNFCSFSPMSAMVSMANAAGRQHPEVFHEVLHRTAARKTADSGAAAKLVGTLR